jgi:DNA-binding NarL/FixJ family response regulator
METPQKISVLIVDDHPSVRYGLRRILEDQEFVGEIDEAGSGAVALQKTTDHEYDVALMDISLPEVNGLQVTEGILRNNTNIKVIAYTMHREARYIREMFQIGASGYILKDDEREDILTGIHTVMNGELFLSPKISDFRLSELGKIGKDTRKSRHEDHLRSIVYLICKGKSSKQIAEILHLSQRTIEQYRRNIHEQFGLESVASLIKYGIEQGIDNDEILNSRFAGHIYKMR